MEKVETLEISKQLGIRKKKTMRQLESPPKNDECSDIFFFKFGLDTWVLPGNDIHLLPIKR